MDSDIIDLREIIEERGTHATARAVISDKDLTLWKVRMIMVRNIPTAILTLLQVDLEPPHVDERALPSLVKHVRLGEA
jgi:hypothetical protein